MHAGLPLAFALRGAGAQVRLANLSFSQLELLDRNVWLDRDVAAITPATDGPGRLLPRADAGPMAGR